MHIFQHTATHHSPGRNTLVMIFILFFTLSILVKSLLNSLEYCDQDPLIPVFPIHNSSKCVTGIFSIVASDEIIRESSLLDNLGRKIAYNNSNWAVVYQNLRKARSWWGMIARVLAKTVAMVRARGIMYKVVDKLVILYVSESWVVTGETIKVLEGFHHWMAWCIMGATMTRGAGGDWE